MILIILIIVLKNVKIIIILMKQIIISVQALVSGFMIKQFLKRKNVLIIVKMILFIYMNIIKFVIKNAPMEHFIVKKIEFA